MVRLHHNNNNNSKVQLTGPKANLGVGKWARSFGESINCKKACEGTTRGQRGREGDKLNKSNLNTLINYQLAACVPRGAN